MFTNSIILGELYNTNYPIYKEDGFVIYIRPYTNYFIEYPYFVLAINRYGNTMHCIDTQICRISMREARILGYEYESLILTEDEKNKLINILKDKSIWGKMISFLYADSEYSDEDFDIYYEIDKIREAPDYSKLEYTTDQLYKFRKSNIKLLDTLKELFRGSTCKKDEIVYEDSYYIIHYFPESDTLNIYDKDNNKFSGSINRKTQNFVQDKEDNDIHYYRNLLSKEIIFDSNFRFNLIEYISLKHIIYNTYYLDFSDIIHTPIPLIEA